MPELDQDAHHTLAKKDAQEGAVLLGNDGILPLNDDEVGNLAVIGAFANHTAVVAKQGVKHHFVRTAI